MSQRKIMMICLVVLGVLFGAMTFSFIKSSDKFQGMFQKNESQWKWEDSWNGNMPANPSPKLEEQAKPQLAPQSPVVVESYKDALQKSSELGMPVLVFYTADWCVYCKKMKAETLSNSKVSEAMKKYIVVYVNTDKDRSSVGKFGVTGLPSYVITNSNEDKLKMAGGFMNADSFSNWLKDYQSK